MITKERLEELIALNKPFWYVYDSNILKTINAKYWRIVDNKICWYADSSLYRSFENLFENKEDAEWWLQYGNIQRTDTLSLPSWEEIIKEVVYEKNIYGYDGKNYVLIIENYGNEPTIEISCLNDYSGIFEAYDKPLTKENYTEACRLAKKLFLGEKSE